MSPQASTPAGVQSNTPAPAPPSNTSMAARGFAGPWVDQLLQALGAPLTDNNRAALRLWASSEGTLQSNNPLAISGRYPGATSCIAQCSQPDPSKARYSSPVYAYGTIDQGVAATKSFMSGSYYTGVVSAFRNDLGLAAIWSAIHSSPWCTGCQSGQYPVALGQWIHAQGGAGVATYDNGTVGGPNAPASATTGTPTSNNCPDPTATTFQWNRPGGCCSNVYLINTGVGTHLFSECQARAVAGVALMVVGASVMTVGVLLIAAYGLKRSGALGYAQAIPGPAGTVAEAVNTKGQSLQGTAKYRQRTGFWREQQATNESRAQQRAGERARYAGDRELARSQIAKEKAEQVEGYQYRQARINRGEPLPGEG